MTTTSLKAHPAESFLLFLLPFRNLMLSSIEPSHASSLPHPSAAMFGKINLCDWRKKLSWFGATRDSM